MGWLGRAANVAPYTGAWIEIANETNSLVDTIVAPYTGAWIEILWYFLSLSGFGGRSLHGSVD